jgi:tRNA (mo5U34)-methyltransferase
MIVDRDQMRQIWQLVLGHEPAEAEYDYWLPKIREYDIGPRKFVTIALGLDPARTLDEAGAAAAIGGSENVGLTERAERFVVELGAPADALPKLGTEAWHHSFVLSDGTRIAGGKSLDSLQREFDAIFGPLDLRGRRVLDIGAWNGAFSIEAARRGAAQVLAVDLYTWIDPRFRGLERFLYIRKQSGYSNIDYKILDAHDVSGAAIGRFDIVLFLDVLYHLREPLSVFDRFAEMAGECLVLQTYLDQVGDVPFPAMRYFPGAELAGDPSNWWGPNRACVEALLRTAGFADIRSRQHPTGTDRGIFHARK